MQAQTAFANRVNHRQSAPIPTSVHWSRLIFREPQRICTITTVKENSAAEMDTWPAGLEAAEALITEYVFGWYHNVRTSRDEFRKV